MNQKVLDVIIEAIAGDRLDWKRTWTPGSGAINHITKIAYKWVNTYLNYCGTEFLTFNQIKQKKYSLKKWSKGFPVMFALFENKADEMEKDKFLWWKYYTVFSLYDCLDSEGKEFIETKKSKSYETPEILCNYLEREKIEIKVWEPAYWLWKDYITMPPAEKFFWKEEYEAVLAHEIVHSTGAEKRLCRFPKTGEPPRQKYGKEYAKEELVAELGAVLLTGNRVSENSIAYLQSWLGKLKASEQKKDIFDAFNLASKAYDFITITK